MGRRSERLSKQGMLASDLAGEGDVIQVVSRAFDVLRCFEGHEARLGNLEISNRCGLPRSTVSRLTHTLTRMGQLVYLPRDQKYRIGPSAVAMSTSMMRGLQLRNLIRLRLQDVAEQLPGTVGFVIPDRFHLVYLEFGRAANALGLNSTHRQPHRDGEHRGRPRLYGGARSPMSATPCWRKWSAKFRKAPSCCGPVWRTTAASCANTAMSSPAACGARISTVSRCRCGRRNTRPSSWSRSVCLSAMYDEKRLHKEVAPRILELSAAIGGLLEGADGELFSDRHRRASRFR